MSTNTPNSKLSWTPPHCPNPDCPHHHPRSRVNWRYRRRGYMRRRRAPFRVPRFQCTTCGRGFCQQTFESTYRLKRPNLLPRIAMLSANGMANRQIARCLGCAPATVDAQLSRVGRHSLLFLSQLRPPTTTCRDIVFDGLSTFEYSQYFPFEILTGVDRNTSYILAFSDAPLRRSGRMTEQQKRRREKLEASLGRPDPGAVQEAASEVLREAARNAMRAIFRTDKHMAYPRALRTVSCPFEHRQTSSRKRRDQYNELFEINSLDRLLRHSQANHRRETIAFARRRQRSMERFAVFVVWRNWIKHRWEKGRCGTPAMELGLTAHEWTFRRVLNRRLFPGHVDLPRQWQRYYWGQVETPAIGVNRHHVARYAF